LPSGFSRPQSQSSSNSIAIDPSNLYILHLSSAKSWRGGERQIAFLADELNQKGIKQAIICVAGSKMEAWCKSSGIPFFSYKKRFSINPLVAWEISRVCHRIQPTHLHVHDSHSHTFAILAIAFFGVKAPMIVHRRVDFPVKNNWLSNWKYNHFSVRAIICVSQFIQEMTRPAIHRKSVIHTVHSGIDLHQGTNLKGTDLRKEFGIAPGQKIIVNLAAIAPHKDYFTFVKTAKLLLERGLSAKFLLVGGDGGERAAIEEYIQKNELTGQLILTGFRTDVPDILQQSDLFLFTSKTEGLGGAVLDALYAGVPVVATAAGGVPEIIKDGFCGFLAPVGDAECLARKVEELLMDKELQGRFRHNGLEAIQAFSKREMAAKVLGIYQSIS